jgi:anti-sigma factor RsiW
MSNDSHYDRFRELGWRGKLSAGEESELRAWLAAHPERQAEWEAEASLTELLGRLPDAPVGGNFTARVLDTTQREERERLRGHSPLWRGLRLGFRWLPRVALASVMFGAGLFSFRYARQAQHARLLEGVEVVSQVASLPSPEILRDFDAIRALDPAPAADEELLRLMR